MASGSTKADGNPRERTMVFTIRRPPNGIVLVNRLVLMAACQGEAGGKENDAETRCPVGGGT